MYWRICFWFLLCSLSLQFVQFSVKNHFFKHYICSLKILGIPKCFADYEHAHGWVQIICKKKKSGLKFILWNFDLKSGSSKQKSPSLLEKTYILVCYGLFMLGNFCIGNSKIEGILKCIHSWKILVMIFSQSEASFSIFWILFFYNITNVM